MRKLLVVCGLALVSLPLWAQIGTASLSWQHNGQYVDGTAATIYEFRVYHSRIASVGPYSFVDSVPGGVFGFDHINLFNGEHFWTVTAVDIALQESAMSNFATKTIAEGNNESPLPSAPTNLVVQ